MDYKDSQPLEDVALELNRAQIDYEIVPEDVLCQCRPEDGEFVVGEEPMRALIVSRRGYMSQRAYRWCEEAEAAGVPIFFIDEQPKLVHPLSIEKSRTPESAVGWVIAMTDLVPQLRQKGLQEIQCNTWEPYLRYYHYVHDDGEVILFFNEDPHESVNTWVTVPMTEKLCWYDAFDNVLKPVEQMGNRVHLTLAPYQALVLCAGQEGAYQESVSEKARTISVEQPWRLCLVRAGEEDTYKEMTTGLVNLAAADQYPDFSGTMTYETEIKIWGDVSKVEIDLGEVYETAEVLVNGKSAGVRIAPPYVLFTKDLFKPGANRLTVRVVNTLGHQESQRDRFGMTLPQEPVGLLGPVVLRVE